MEIQRQSQRVSNQVPAGVSFGQQGSAAGISPRDILNILRQRMILILILTILGFVVGAGSWFLLKRYAREYTATGSIEVLSPINKDPLAFTYSLVAKDLQFEYRQTVAEMISQQELFQDLLERDTIRNTQWIKSFSRSGGKATTGALSDDDIDYNQALRTLKSKVIITPERDSSYIKVSMSCGLASESALIVNELIELFISSRSAVVEGDITQKVGSLTKQKQDLTDLLTTQQNRMAGVRTSTTSSDFEGRNYMDPYTQKVANLELLENNLVLEITNLEVMLESLKTQATGVIKEQVSQQVERDAVVVNLNQILNSWQAELSSKIVRFGEDHTRVFEIKERIAEIEEQRSARRKEIGEIIRQANLSNGSDQLRILETRLESLQEEKTAAEEQKRTVDIARASYENLKIEIEETRSRIEAVTQSIDKYTIVKNDADTVKVKSTSKASEPLDMSFPLWQVFFPGGTFMGILLGVGLAFLLEQLNENVRTARDVQRHLRIPLLGVIPDKREDKFMGGIEPALAVQKVPYSILSEAYRRLRSNLKLSANADAKSFLVTSGMAGDGKTSVAVNLGLSFAAQGKKILLIDANFWRPNFNTLFPDTRPVGKKPLPPVNGLEVEDVEPETENGTIDLGLSTVLMGLCGYHEVIRPSGVANCDVVDAGMLPSNPAELLGGIQMEQFIKHQSEKYDHIIIDGPPILLVGDVKILARLVDGNILVFNAQETKRGAAMRVIRELGLVKAPITGCVLLGVKAMKGGYFREQYKSYQDYYKPQLAVAAS